MNNKMFSFVLLIWTMKVIIIEAITTYPANAGYTISSFIPAWSINEAF